MNLTQALQIVIAHSITKIEAGHYPEPETMINALAAIVDANPATVTSMNRFNERLTTLQRVHAPVPPPQFEHWAIMAQTDEGLWETVGMRDTYESAYRWHQSADLSGAVRIVGVTK